MMQSERSRDCRRCNQHNFANLLFYCEIIKAMLCLAARVLCGKIEIDKRKVQSVIKIESFRFLGDER